MFSSIQLQLLPCRACNLGRPISRHLFHVVHAGTITIKEMLRGLSVKGTIGAGAMASPHVSHAHVVGHKRCHPIRRLISTLAAPLSTRQPQHMGP